MTHISASYGISESNFTELFSDRIQQINQSVFGELSSSASKGNQNSIDMLHNLALRNDTVGSQAERILFDLFSGTLPSTKGVDVDIKKSSLKLYESMDRSKFESGTNKLTQPSALLFIAGSAIEGISHIKENISSVFSQNEVSQSEFEQVEMDDLWAPNRFVSDDELTASSAKLDLNGKVSSNRPLGLIDPVTKENKLSDIMSEKLNSQYNIFLNQAELIPVNTGNHWVLFAAYKDSSEKIKSVVFDSRPPLSEEMLGKFKDTAAMIGAEELTYIVEDLQEHVPNGCGLFVSSLMSRINKSIDNENTPEIITKDFIRIFKSKNKEQQGKFNLSQRLTLREGTLFK